MKRITPFLWVVAGMAIAFLVSFKMQEPQREFSIVTLGPVKTTFYLGNDKYKEIAAPKHKNELVNQLNEFGKDGWSFKEETKDGLIFERTKH